MQSNKLKALAATLSTAFLLSSCGEQIDVVRGAWFSCSNQLGRVRDYYEEQE